MDKVERTKQLLANTLRSMSREMPLKKISVQKLVERCQLNRGTFYYHFRDISDLINWIYHTEITLPIYHYLRSYTEGELDSSEQVLRLLYANKDFFMQAIQMEGQNNLRDYILTETQTNWVCLRDRILELRGTDYASLDETIREEMDHLLKSFCYGHYFTTLQWIQDGMPLPPERLAVILDTSASKGIFSALSELLSGRALFGGAV